MDRTDLATAFITDLMRGDLPEDSYWKDSVGDSDGPPLLDNLKNPVLFTATCAKISTALIGFFAVNHAWSSEPNAENLIIDVITVPIIFKLNKTSNAAYAAFVKGRAAANRVLKSSWIPSNLTKRLSRWTFQGIQSVLGYSFDNLP